MKRIAIAIASAALFASATTATALDPGVFVPGAVLDESQVCRYVETFEVVDEQLFEDGSGTRTFFISNNCNSSTALVVVEVENND